MEVSSSVAGIPQPESPKIMSTGAAESSKENVPVVVPPKVRVRSNSFIDWEAVLDEMVLPPVAASHSLAAHFKKSDTGTSKNSDKLDIDEFLNVMCFSNKNTDSEQDSQTRRTLNDVLDMLCSPDANTQDQNSANSTTQSDHFDENLNLLQTQQFVYRYRELREVAAQTSFDLSTVPVINITNDKVPNVLSILGQNVNTMPDGFTLYNDIDKIGTEKWLETAIRAIDKFSFNRKTMENVDIVETNNTFDMYVDDKIKIDLKRVRQGGTVIYQLNKTDQKKRTRDSSVETYESSDDRTKLGSSIDYIRRNKELISNHFNVNVVDKSKIRHKIHDILSKVYEALQSNKVPAIEIRNSRRKSNCVFKDGRLKCAPLREAPLRKIRFKSKIFPRILYLLAKIYTLIENKSKITKRELFYQTKRLLKTQTQIHGPLEEVTRMLGIGHWHLNIVTSCGLVFGNLKFVWASGETTNCNVQATSIPYDLEDIVEMHCTAQFILVLEKESIFHKLLEEELPKKLARPFLMITGKGFPKINTRLFLNKISTMMALPVFIVCDADIYGIKIMLAYRFGVANNCHLSDDLAVPNARWLGVFPSDIVKYGLKYQTLTERDRKTIDMVMKYPCLDEHPKIIEEIRVLADSNRKASIESLIKTDMFLSHTYIPTKFLNKDFL